MMNQKRIVVSVISDLVSDQRVHKVCTYLHNKGYTVTLIGRCFKESLPLEERAYRALRIRCYFRRGVAQYAEFHVKLFQTLIYQRADIFLANDLDTLVPNFVHAWLRKKKLVYDSHEYFTGTPELQQKPFKRKVWKRIEALLLPKLKYAYTVNASIAALYKKECGVAMKVVRNVPLCKQHRAPLQMPPFPPGKFVLLLQGAGINQDRGAEELIESMQLLPAHFHLVLVGGGDVWDQLQTRASRLNLSHKIQFIPKVPLAMLHAYTKQAYLGLSLDKPTCLNHQLILPNKLFDYLHAGVPVLASRTVEVKQVVEGHKVGMCLEELTPESIAKAVQWIYNHNDVYSQWKQNTTEAAKAFCWEREQEVLDEIFND